MLATSDPEGHRQAIADHAADTLLSASLIEDRLHAWRRQTMNDDGDCLALDDYMSAETIEDLLDFVCAPA